MPFEDSFAEAFAPWLPTLYDIERKKADGESPYTLIGLDKLVADAAMTYFTQTDLNRLNIRFVERYGRRRINAESLEIWQIRLQNRFDELVAKYQRAYRLYSLNGTKIDSDITQGSSASYSSQSKQINTPDAAVNANDNYADNLSKGSGSSSSEMKGQYLEDLHRNLDTYRDLDTQFVGEFENLFLNVFWY